ncbi:unnamed protein product [Zymoseptoria tritici ST99CH_1A5]|uniref:Ribonuclease H2 subunit B n=3 Tax=Zymoseptoria tritici TaxID=1047171 RepID=A0A1X7RKC1_ZYMT9|nr:unnamed protein product [Zymoseptoria tritici ST99CH_3D7]SMR46191.1 unnamed protein product [Zymoseptoria tritici ST99CH_1E4]SMR47443.1 unnamed protein product [Zymoseptoria tritici ST99CH_3D1]SMY21341.1 unnamed protein product [Zymoseptoria tritici ST99CH_1A5]
MPAKTRAKPSAAKAKKSEAIKISTTLKTLPPSEDSPPLLCVLPKDASPEAKFVSLRNPASKEGTSRYFVCPKKGFFELVKVGGSKQEACRSWIVASRGVEEEEEEATSQEQDTRVDSQQQSQVSQQDKEQDESTESDGYILSSPSLLLATPLDPLFLLLPQLTASSQSNPSAKEYLAPSDYISLLTTSSPHLTSLISASPHLTRILEVRIEAVSDVMDMGDGDKMYAFSRDKLAGVLVEKARRMVGGEGGLPRSLEARFVKGVLDVPVLGERREGQGVSIADRSREEEDTQPECEGSEAADAEATAPPAASTSDSCPPAEILSLLRLRVALDFLQTSYLPPPLTTQLQPHFAPHISFAPLESHLSHLATLKKEAAALRSLSDNISRKRPLGEDDEEAYGKSDAKRRKEEEERERKKKLEKEKSVGMRRLGKADVSGMKKMSSFFTKAAPLKK